MAWVRISLALFILIALPECTSQVNRQTIRFKGLEPTTKNFSGILTLPEAPQQKVPVVILFHGTAGPDSRYEFHRPALLEAGIATFEVDFKSNIYTGPSDRPPVETFLPWAFGALVAIRSNPRIDPERVAIMGFSLGGHISVTAASRKVVKKWLGPDEQGFTAHVGFYPACKRLKKHFDSTGPTGAPILIMSGEKDSWGDGETCKNFCDWLNEKQPGVVSLKLYPDAHHGFDRAGSWKGYAPFAKNQTAILQWDPEAAYDSRKRAVSFLREALDLQPNIKP
jgi:dienelactone hydrolase